MKFIQVRTCLAYGSINKHRICKGKNNLKNLVSISCTLLVGLSPSRKVEKNSSCSKNTSRCILFSFVGMQCKQAEDIHILKCLGVNPRPTGNQVKRLNIRLRLSILRALQVRTDNSSAVTVHSTLRSYTSSTKSLLIIIYKLLQLFSRCK